MACENSKQARVWYTDDNGRLQNFKTYSPGVSFTVSREKGANCKNATSSWIPGPIYVACSDVQFSRSVIYSYCWPSWTLLAGGTFSVSNISRESCGLVHKQTLIISGTMISDRGTIIARGDTHGGNWAISGLFQAQGSTDGYRLKITDKRGQVFDGGFQEKNPAPKIDCGESCPPDTCECACGAAIHCYGRNGQLVKRFMRSAKG